MHTVRADAVRKWWSVRLDPELEDIILGGHLSGAVRFVLSNAQAYHLSISSEDIDSLEVWSKGESD